MNLLAWTEPEDRVRTAPVGRRCERCRCVLGAYTWGRHCAPCRLALVDARIASSAAPAGAAGRIESGTGCARTLERRRRAAGVPTESALAVLRALVERPLDGRELSVLVAGTGTRVSSTVAGLSARGWIERAPGSRTRWRLTATGRAALARGGTHA